MRIPPSASSARSRKSRDRRNQIGSRPAVPAALCSRSSSRRSAGVNATVSQSHASRSQRIFRRRTSEARSSDACRHDSQNLPGRATPVRLLQRLEPHPGLRPDHARTFRAAPLSDLPRLEQAGPDAGRSEQIGGRTAGQSAADDGHVGHHRASEAGDRRLLRSRVTREPEGSTVAGHGDTLFNRTGRRAIAAAPGSSGPASAG